MAWLCRHKTQLFIRNLNKVGLVKRLDAQLRLWVNTGTVNITVGNVDTNNQSYLLTPANNTFSNTCPLLVNFQPSTSADTGILKTATSNIVAGLYIGRPPTTSFAGIQCLSVVYWYSLS